MSGLPYGVSDDEQEVRRPYSAPVSHEDNSVVDTPELDLLKSAFGDAVSARAVANLPESSKVMVPSDAEWKKTTENFYSGVNATTPDMKFRALAQLIKWFIINTTSDKVNTHIAEKFPTGVSKYIDSVWQVPAGHTYRSILRHKIAQATANLVARENFREIKPYVAAHGSNTLTPETCYDFYYAPTNPAKQTVNIADSGYSRSSNVRGTRAAHRVDQKRDRSGSGGRGEGTESEDFYGPQRF